MPEIGKVQEVNLVTKNSELTPAFVCSASRAFARRRIFFFDPET